MLCVSKKNSSHVFYGEEPPTNLHRGRKVTIPQVQVSGCLCNPEGSAQGTVHALMLPALGGAAGLSPWQGFPEFLWILLWWVRSWGSVSYLLIFS